jgi:hypothetical protein
VNSLTVDQLRAERLQLLAREENAIAQVHAVRGMIKFCDELIAKAEKTVQPPAPAPTSSASSP